MVEFRQRESHTRRRLISIRKVRRTTVRTDPTVPPSGENRGTVGGTVDDGGEAQSPGPSPQTPSEGDRGDGRDDPQPSLSGLEDLAK